MLSLNRIASASNSNIVSEGCMIRFTETKEGLECYKCDSKIAESIPRYHIRLEVIDGNDRAIVILFDEPTTSLIDCTVSDYINSVRKMKHLEVIRCLRVWLRDDDVELAAEKDSALRRAARWCAIPFFIMLSQNVVSYGSKAMPCYSWYSKYVGDVVNGTTAMPEILRSQNLLWISML
ncbi:hypothetical protein F0562_006410 [Nyssa sinensis]|uniref:Replication factor A C-terminal domain-containing protein n=1 Tax=Nyssa sinensis TaxID=561372 RepID=A0A5J5ALL0_9ASTE|nr:hypothetical protein F0562_006410 [Nyssa sinensis]